MMRKLVILGAIFSFGAAVPATAQQFDLDCRRASTGDYDINIPTLHIQVDIAEGLWCRDRCTKVVPIARVDTETLVLDENTDFTQVNFLMLEIDSIKIFDAFDFEGDFERITEYNCEIQDFGNFQNYLVEPPRLRNSHVLLDAFAPRNIPRGLIQPAADGDVRFALAVSAEGQVVSCETRVSSGNDELDRFNCAVMMALGLQFDAARDRFGIPTSSYFERTTVFRGWSE